MSDGKQSSDRRVRIGQDARRSIPDHPDALLKTAEAAYLLGLSARTLEAYCLKGGGPPFIALSPKAVRYQRRDLEAWIESRKRCSTSENSAGTTNPITDDPSGTAASQAQRR